MKKTGLIMLALLSLPACQDKETPGSLEVEADVIYLPAQEGTRHILVDATTEWRLEYDTSTPWMSTDLHGGKALRKYFTVSYLENPNSSERTCRIKVFTTDRNASRELLLIQRKQPSVITFDPEVFQAECWAGSYSVPFTDNLRDLAGLRLTTDSDWINPYPFSAGDTQVEFYLSRVPSAVSGSRTGHIYASVDVEDEGTVTGVLTIVQFAKTNQ